MYPQRRPESGNYRARKQGRLLSAWALEPRYLPASTLPAPLTNPTVDRSAFVEQLGDQFGADFTQFDLNTIAEHALGAAWAAQPQRQIANDQGLLPLKANGGVEIYLTEPELGGETLLSSIPWMPMADKLVLNGTLSERDRSDIYALQVGSDQEPFRIVLAPIDKDGNVPALTVWDSTGKPIYHWTSADSKVPLDVQFSLPAELAESLKDSPWVYVGVTLPGGDDGGGDDSYSGPSDDSAPPASSMPGDDPGSGHPPPSNYSLTVERGSGAKPPPGPTSGYGGEGGSHGNGKGSSGNDSRLTPPGRIGLTDSIESPGGDPSLGGDGSTSKETDDSELAAHSSPGSGSNGLSFVPSGTARQLTGSGLGVDPSGEDGVAIAATDNLEIATVNLDNLPPEVLAQILANHSGQLAFEELPLAGSLIGPLTTPPVMAAATGEGQQGGQLTAGPLNDPMLLSYAIAALTPAQDFGDGDLSFERPSRLVTLGLPSLGFAAALAYGFFYPTAGRAARPRRVLRSAESIAPDCTPIEPR